LAFLAAKRPKTTLVTFTLLSSAHTMHESTGVAIGGGHWRHVHTRLQLLSYW